MKEELLEKIKPEEEKAGEAVNNTNENTKIEDQKEKNKQEIEKKFEQSKTENKKNQDKNIKKDKNNQDNNIQNKNNKNVNNKNENNQSKNNQSKNNQDKNTQEKNKEKEQKKQNKKEAKLNKKENKDKTKNTKPKNKKKIIIASITSLIILLAILLFSTIFALINLNNNKIVSGVKIEGIEVANLSKDEAIQKLETIYQEKLEKEIKVKYNDYESNISPNMLEVKYAIEDSVNQAMQIGRDGNIFSNNYNILFALMGKKDINVNMSLNEEIAKKTIEDIGANIPGIVIESSYYIEDNNLIITKGTKGIIVDTEKLLNLVKERLENKEIIDDYIEIPVNEKDPDPINIDKIHEEVYKEVQDAYVTKDPFTIHPEVEGVDFNVDEAKAQIEAEDKEEYTIPLTITKPKVTINDLGTEAFPDRLSTFSTIYDAGLTDRSTNLKIACEKINNQVVMPGETFSYNQTLGERTIAAGYKSAAIYSNGEVVDGLGGGICQISTTLYDAVLFANLEIVERRNHQFITSYVGPGEDATVVYGMTDFRFKNTRQYPIKIVASAQNGVAKVEIYGIKEDVEYDISLDVKRVATIPKTTKYIEDASLPVGTEKVKQNGTNGVQTETYLVKSLNGKVVSRTLLSKDTYNAMQKIVLKGTKGSSNTNNKNNNENKDNNTNKEENNNTSKNTVNNSTNNNSTTNNKTNENNTSNNESKNNTNTNNITANNNTTKN